jgi:aminopeptidase YwaD
VGVIFAVAISNIQAMYRLKAISFIVFLFFVFTASAQNNGSAPDTTAPPSTTFVDTVTHVYNMDSLDNSKKFKDGIEFKRMMALQSENDKIWIKKQIAALTARNMRGRGYVKDGVDSAAIYIMKRFKEFKLKSVAGNGSFTQGFAFPVNTFPGKMKLVTNGDSLKPGADYLIDPASSSFFAHDLKVRRINLNDISDAAVWKATLAQIDGGAAYYLENVDIFCGKILNVKRSVFLALLPKGCYIIPQASRMQWSVSRDTIAATVFYVHPDALPKTLKSVSVAVTAQFIPRSRNQNIVGCIPGAIKDTFIAFTAHYDHLGMMGDTVAFPGASDNASGVAMMLYLASFYHKHPPRYSILFIAFAGEEASLMGSEFFVKNPMVPLKSIKFLTNLDIMGDATNGVTVVNASENPTQFGILKEINDREKYVPEVRSKGPAANSDHYYFARAGVPSFFIYSNGGKGYMQDIYDKPKEITANNIDGVAKLLITFAKELN